MLFRLRSQKGVMSVTLSKKTLIQWLDFKSHNIVDFFFFHVSLQFPSKHPSFGAALYASHCIQNVL